MEDYVMFSCELKHRDFYLKGDEVIVKFQARENELWLEAMSVLLKLRKEWIAFNPNHFISLTVRNGKSSRVYKARDRCWDKLLKNIKEVDKQTRAEWESGQHAGFQQMRW